VLSISTISASLALLALQWLPAPANAALRSDEQDEADFIEAEQPAEAVFDAEQLAEAAFADVQPAPAKALEAARARTTVMTADSFRVRTF
jgi:hypothetical protein